MNSRRLALFGGVGSLNLGTVMAARAVLEIQARVGIHGPAEPGKPLLPPDPGMLEIFFDRTLEKTVCEMPVLPDRPREQWRRGRPLR